MASRTGNQCNQLSQFPFTKTTERIFRVIKNMLHAFNYSSDVRLIDNNL